MNDNNYQYVVKTIKQAVEKSRYRATKVGNAELFSLYYGIGKYVSENTRNGTWGTDAIKTIISLQKKILQRMCKNTTKPIQGYIQLILMENGSHIGCLLETL